METLGIAPGNKAEGLIAKLAYKTETTKTYTQREITLLLLQSRHGPREAARTSVSR